jgi:flagellar protein FlbD
VIILTRLGGHALALNPDLIERAEATPDTVITMVDGHKLVIEESVDEVVTRVRRWRASVASEAYYLSNDGAEDTGQDDDLFQDTNDITTHSALGSGGARVLHLPNRER